MCPGQHHPHFHVPDPGSTCLPLALDPCLSSRCIPSHQLTARGGREEHIVLVPTLQIENRDIHMSTVHQPYVNLNKTARSVRQPK